LQSQKGNGLEETNLGSLAQLVQSICLTSRGSGVRTPQLPRKPSFDGFFFGMGTLFYILYSGIADRYYVGHTTEAMEERLRKHNSRHKGFTGKFNDWLCVYTEEYETKEAGYKRELEVKGWKSRKKIEAMIALKKT
jgi:putative endonuclease